MGYHTALAAAVCLAFWSTPSSGQGFGGLLPVGTDERPPTPGPGASSNCRPLFECQEAVLSKPEACKLPDGSQGVVCSVKTDPDTGVRTVAVGGREARPQEDARFLPSRSARGKGQNSTTVREIARSPLPEAAKRLLIAGAAVSADDTRKVDTAIRKAQSSAAAAATVIGRPVARPSPEVVLREASSRAEAEVKKQVEISETLAASGKGAAAPRSTTAVFNLNFRTSPEAQQIGLRALRTLRTAQILAAAASGRPAGGSGPTRRPPTRPTRRPPTRPTRRATSPVRDERLPFVLNRNLLNRNFSDILKANFTRERATLRRTKRGIPIPGCIPEPPILCNSLARYRRPDGSCNNLFVARWGRRLTGLRRLLPNTYADGILAPTSSPGLPDARRVSEVVMESVSAPSFLYTLSVMTWGQFMDHDLSISPIFQLIGGRGIECCLPSTSPPPFPPVHPQCLPLHIRGGDPFYGPHSQRCMNFVRSIPELSPSCMFEPANQLNDITHWMDGSNIYGSSQAKQQSLRTGSGGRMKTSAGNLLPRESVVFNPGTGYGTSCQGRVCFIAGDDRVNENPLLAFYHTIFVREHNRVAQALRILHPVWNDNRLFNEARRIVVAEWQHISFNEWLPTLIGFGYASTVGLRPLPFGYSNVYFSFLNPSIANVFSTAGFRLHSLIQDVIQFISTSGAVTSSTLLRRAYFEPSSLTISTQFERLARGLSTQMPQSFDRRFTQEIRGHLFSTGNFGLDLVAMNLQRGRDHGIAKYHTVLRHCTGLTVNSWNSFLTVMSFANMNRLRSIYPSWRNVDLYAGINLERPLQPALLGPTARCIVAEQFLRLKYTDRFYYELGGQPGSFTPAQLAEIRKSRWARVLCNNVGGSFTQVQQLPFFQPNLFGFLNPPVSCNTIPDINLAVF